MDERIEARIAGLEAEIATLKAMVASDAETEVEAGRPAKRRRRHGRGLRPAATIQILSNTVTDFVAT